MGGTTARLGRAHMWLHVSRLGLDIVPDGHRSPGTRLRGCKVIGHTGCIRLLLSLWRENIFYTCASNVKFNSAHIYHWAQFSLQT